MTAFFYKAVRKLRLNKQLLHAAERISNAWNRADGGNLKKTDPELVAASEELLGRWSPDPGMSCIRPAAVPSSAEVDLMIVIAAYNVEQYLAECLESVARQETAYRIQAIVVDDGSTDRTGQIADTYASDPRFLVVHQENRGHSGARNRALEKLNGAYVMFLDADDLLEPGAVDLLLRTAYETHASIVEGTYRAVDEAGRDLGLVKQRDGILDPLTQLTGFAWGKVFRSRFFEQVYFPEGYWFEDTLMRQILYPIVQAEGGITVGVSAPIYQYRQNSQGISNTSKRRAKCIDTLWITRNLGADREKLGIAYAQSYYDHLLQMIQLSYHRMKYMPKEIQKAAFVLYADWMDRKVGDCSATDPDKRLLERALRGKQFALYRAACELGR